tara:strand:- start:3131 stop:3523 length:393 start_codon:yes stop_codon:yes gene_type:complete
VKKDIMSKNKLEIDKIVNKIAWLGVPGLVLLIFIVISGQIFLSGPSITWALAHIGFFGLGGMIPGIFVLIILSKYSSKITAYGIEKTILLVINKMEKNGKSKNEIINEINNYRISKKLKEKIINYIQQVS